MLEDFGSMGDQDIIAIHYCQIYEELVNANNGSEEFEQYLL
ncbi:MAG: hypothetical protein R3A45_07610 [Bdellovibrionota bacterium]